MNLQRALRPLIGLPFLLATLWLAVPPAADAAVRVRGSSYPVSEFVIEYAADHPDHVALREIERLDVGLRYTRDGYAAPRPVDHTARIRLKRLPRGTHFYPSALKYINWWIVRTFNQEGIHGVIVTTPDIEPGSGRDLRPAGETRLRLRIWTGRIADVRTLADGTRFDELPEDTLTNLPIHEWMRDESPAQVGGEGDLLHVTELEDYARQLSRHPGRRVDAELSPGRQPGTTRVNYRVAENKPWTVYAQMTNTGTDETSKWRQNLGFVHNQLTNRDDILNLNYVTGDFDSVHGFQASYDAPFDVQKPRLRYRVGGSYSQYDASEVGFSRAKFKGESVEGDFQLTYNLMQRGDLFVDVLGGMRWQKLETDNEFLGISAEDSFFLPRIGLAVEREEATSSLSASAAIEMNVPEVAGTDAQDSMLLGRVDPDERFAVFRWSGNYSFYLDPLLNGPAWRDMSTPETTTLAHELAFNVKGQFTPDRLVPQHRQVAGGLYTVRGYEQSVVAGDTVVMGSAEYRFHHPRSWGLQEDPVELPLIGDFNYAPPHVLGRPDWDLVYKVFFDGAQVMQSDALSFEEDETLFSFGGGLELQLLRNFRVRMDTGVALSDLETRSVDVGDTRMHFGGTLLY